MVKDPQSGYSPGRRGLGWLKMKKALATIDCVVVGVEVGHGKRHGVLSDYTFAVRDESTGELVTIGKAYSGLTDAEIAEMTRWFEAHTIRQFGRYRVVEPTVVVEVAFDVIMRSNRHKSGFALRFPRIAHLRLDKSPDEIDTLATVTRAPRGPAAGRGAPRDRGPPGRRPGHCGGAGGRGITDRSPRSARALPLDGQVQAVAPFGPAAVVHRDVRVTEEHEHERELGRRHAGAVVADEAFAPHDAGLLELRPQLVTVTEALRSPGDACRPPAR